MECCSATRVSRYIMCSFLAQSNSLQKVEAWWWSKGDGCADASEEERASLALHLFGRTLGILYQTFQVIRTLDYLTRKIIYAAGRHDGGAAKLITPWGSGCSAQLLSFRSTPRALWHCRWSEPRGFKRYMCFHKIIQTLKDWGWWYWTLNWSRVASYMHEVCRIDRSFRVLEFNWIVRIAVQSSRWDVSCRCNTFVF